jgi:putative SOS response-associated peptidase YedK
MCGRFTFSATPEEIQAAFPAVEIRGQHTPRYNIAPTQPVAVIPNAANLYLDYFIWGLIPSWSKDPKMGAKMINARGETVAEKPAFRAALKRRRCLILTTGFYEWRKESDGSKTPMYIHLKSGLPFAFAGLWEIWHSPQGDEVYSCTIITTEPNELIASIHNRMPVILDPNTYDLWLDPTERRGEDLTHLLTAYPADLIDAYPVSSEVNRPGNDSPFLIQPL